MNDTQYLTIIISSDFIANKISELLSKKEINHYILPKCRGATIKFNVLEFLGFTDTKRTTLLFKSREELKRLILKFILKYYNKKNNGIMFSVPIGEYNMDYENQVFFGIVNAGKGEKLADIIRQECQAGSTIFDARGRGVEDQSFMGMQIGSNKEVVVSVMRKEQISKIKKSIKDNFEEENTDIVSFFLPVTDFNMLYQ